jgi:hypothetical protein
MSAYFPDHTPIRKRLPIAHDRSSYQTREKGGCRSQALKLTLGAEDPPHKQMPECGKWHCFFQHWNARLVSVLDMSTRRLQHGAGSLVLAGANTNPI